MLLAAEHHYQGCIRLRRGFEVVEANILVFRVGKVLFAWGEAYRGYLKVLCSLTPAFATAAPAMIIAAVAPLVSAAPLP